MPWMKDLVGSGPLHTQVGVRGATINQHAGRHHVAPGLLHALDGFTHAEPGSQHVIHHQHPCPRGHGRPASDGLDAVLALNVERLDPQEAGHFESNDDAAGRRSGHHVNLGVPVRLGDASAEGGEHVRLLQHAELLKVNVAVATAGEHKVAPKDRPAILEQFPEIDGLSHGR